MNISKVHVLDHFISAEAISAEKDIVMLSSDLSIGMLTIGIDNKLYCYAEQLGENVKYKRSIVTEDCEEVAAARIGTSNKFAISYIKNNEMYLCICEDLYSLDEACFTKLDLKDCIVGEGVSLDNIYIYCQDNAVTLSVLVKSSGGTLQQYTIDVTAEKIGDAKYSALNANFSDIFNIVVGRAHNQRVNGVYTFGEYAYKNQLLYTPTENVYGNTPPNPIRLSTPPEWMDYIVCCSTANREGTHLFGSGSGKLYFYPLEKQHDVSQLGEDNHVLVAESPYFNNVTKMSAYVDDVGQKLYVWILNESRQLIYLFASIGGFDEIIFEEPILFREDVLYFSHNGENLSYVTKDAVYVGKRTENIQYNFSKIYISSETDSVVNFKAYATKVITDEPYQEVLLKCDEEIEAYLNNSFYRFKEVVVRSGPDKVLDIVQSAESVTSPIIDIYVGSEGNSYKTEFNCTQSSYERILNLNTIERFTEAYYIDNKKAKHYLSEGLTNEQIEMAVGTIDQLCRCSTEVTLRSLYNGSYSYNYSREGFISETIHFLDEAFDYVKSFAKSFWDKTFGKLIEFVVETGKKIVKFIIKIGDKIFSFVLKTVSEILYCAVQVLEFIGIPVTKLLDWLTSFLDISGAMELRDVFVDYTNVGMEYGAQTFKTYGDFIQSRISELINQIDNKDKIVCSVEKKDESVLYGNIDAANMYFFDLVYKRAPLEDIEIGEVTCSEQIFLKIKAIEEKAKLLNLSNDIDLDFLYYREESNNLDLCSLATWARNIIFEIGKRSLEIISDVILEVTKVVEDLLSYIKNIINKAIHIPLVSAVLEFFGIDEMSILELVCFVPAFFINLVYSDWRVFTAIDINLRRAETTLASDEEKDNFDLEGMKTHSIMIPSDEVTIKEVCMAMLTAFHAVAYISRLLQVKDNGKVFKFIFTVYDAAVASVSYMYSHYYGVYCQCPMNYNSTEANTATFILWRMKFICGMIKSLFDAGCNFAKIFVAKEADESLVGFKTVFGICMGVLFGASIYYESVAIDEARKLDFFQTVPENSDEYDIELLEIDRSIFISDNVSYIFEDIEGLLSLFDFLALALAKKSPQYSLAILTGWYGFNVLPYIGVIGAHIYTAVKVPELRN